MTITRRNFVYGGSALAAHAWFVPGENSMRPVLQQSMAEATSASYRIDNPYDTVEWSRVLAIVSASHVHIENQEKLDLYYSYFGLRHCPISNYYPSAPTYPLRSMRENQFKVEQNFPLVYNPDTSKTGKARWAAGQLLPGPFRWNEIILNDPHGWAQTLPPELKATLPWALGDYLFKSVPADLIASPNAEHHGFLDSNLHACAVGSLYSSGNFDTRDFYRTQEHGYAIGTGLPWRTAFARMIDQLQYSDGGGITINHPLYSRLSFEEIVTMLDFDPRVLGIEIYNDGDSYDRDRSGPLLALPLWDRILQTGRRCLGLLVPDHSTARGKSVLLVPTASERECLKAYRKGNFIGTLIGTGLQFTRISLEGHRLSVALNAPANIRFITNNGLAKENRENHFVREMDYDIPLDFHGRPTISYVRVEVIDYTSAEQLFSQPIRFLT